MELYFWIVSFSFGFGWFIAAGLFALAGDNAAFRAIRLISRTGADKENYILAIIALLINLIECVTNRLQLKSNGGLPHCSEVKTMGQATIGTLK